LTDPRQFVAAQQILQRESRGVRPSVMTVPAGPPSKAPARALCCSRHPLDIDDYSSIGLWLGFVMLCIGLVLDGRRRPETDEDSRIVPHDFWF
jgi:hypothetical protein